MNYAAATANIQTIAKLKKAFADMLEKATLTDEFKALWVSARDFDDCKKGIAEQIDEMTWEARKNAEEEISEQGRRETLEHQRFESTHYAGTAYA